MRDKNSLSRSGAKLLVEIDDDPSLVVSMYDADAFEARGLVTRAPEFAAVKNCPVRVVMTELGRAQAELHRGEA